MPTEPNHRLYTWPPLLVSALLVLTVWTAWFARVGFDSALATIANHWTVAVTMAFGSFIAGASSEGGGAVAFPIFTKVLGVQPADAKLFALAIQSVGMTAAAVSIFAMRVRVDWRSIRWASVGGVVGLTISLLFIAPIAPAAEVKMLFTAMQASFAVALILAMRRFDYRAQGARMPTKIAPGALIVTGLVGGIASGLFGSGIDLFVFAVLTLLFRMSEKVATPTSVVLMALHSVVGMAIYTLRFGPLPAGVNAMWLAAVPIVVVGAPLGAWVCSRLRRETIAWALVALIGVEVVTSLILIPLTGRVILVATSALLGFFAMFLIMLRCTAFDPVSLRNERQAEIDSFPDQPSAETLPLSTGN